MSLTARTNRWASRVIIILQLATWNAVGIVLLHRGVSTLRRRILETGNVIEADPSADFASIVSSTRRDESEYDLSIQQQSIDKNIEIIIQMDPNRSSSRDDRILSGLKSKRLKDAFEIFSEEQRSKLFLEDPPSFPTTVRGSPSSRLENHLTEIDQSASDDRLEDKNVTSKNSRTIRDREVSGGAKEDITLVPDLSELGTAGSVSREEKEEGEKEEQDLSFAGNTTEREISTTRGEKAGDRKQITVRTGNVRYSRVNEDSATTAAALVTIGAIMLLVGPIVIILRFLDERRQARKLIALPTRAREDPPPTYEQAVLMDEAPRYSTLSLNYDRTPPPSPTLSANYGRYEHRDVVMS